MSFSKQVMRVGVGLAAVAVVFSQPPQARSAVIVGPDDYFTRDKVTCADINGSWVPGKLNRARTKFTSFQSQIQNLQKKRRQAKTAAKKAKIKKKISNLKKNLRAGRSVCNAGPGGAPATPTPGGGGNPTRTPTPTPRPTGCFDVMGNTSCFGIPSGLSGNINRGASSWLSQSCAGCHHESTKRNKSFNTIVAAFSAIDMSGVAQPSNAVLADITAYLNRFSTQ